MAQLFHRNFHFNISFKQLIPNNIATYTHGNSKYSLSNQGFRNNCGMIHAVLNNEHENASFGQNLHEGVKASTDVHICAVIWS